jgi:bacillithiol system protein YtxJ
MPIHELNLVSDPAAARAQLEQASLAGPVVVFKHSPTCPISDRALRQFRAFLAALPAERALGVAHVDVLAQRPLARGLTAALGVEHQSPQALWFERGALAWHDSHAALTVERFERALVQR